MHEICGTRAARVLVSLIEDCAQAHLGTNRVAPSPLRRAGIFLFYPGKWRDAGCRRNCHQTTAYLRVGSLLPWAREGRASDRGIKQPSRWLAARDPRHPLPRGTTSVSQPVTISSCSASCPTGATSFTSTRCVTRSAMPTVRSPCLSCKPTGGDFSMADHNQSRILSLPIFPEMTEARLDHVALRDRRASKAVSDPATWWASCTATRTWAVSAWATGY